MTKRANKGIDLRGPRRSTKPDPPVETAPPPPPPPLLRPWMGKREGNPVSVVFEWCDDLECILLGGMDTKEDEKAFDLIALTGKIALVRPDLLEETSVEDEFASACEDVEAGGEKLRRRARQGGDVAQWRLQAERFVQRPPDADGRDADAEMLIEELINLLLVVGMPARGVLTQQQHQLFLARKWFRENVAAFLCARAWIVGFAKALRPDALCTATEPLEWLVDALGPIPPAPAPDCAHKTRCVKR